jgi:mannose-1-phosphate guanylyltransferase
MSLGESEETLLGAAVDRAARVVGEDNVLVVTAAEQTESVREAVDQLDAGQIISEPIGRNTAPCIGLAAAFLRERNPEAVMAVLPADHHIADPEGFARAAKLALSQASEGEIVTLGIRPSRPETGYGYIEMGEPVEGSEGVFWAEGFKEKPDAETAKKYVEQGTFLWNSGMFFMSAGRIMSEIDSWLPGLAEALGRISESLALGRSAFEETLSSVYPSIEPVSVDYGIMEKVSAMQVVPADFGWNDVGSWAAVADIHPADERGNVSLGDNLLIDTDGSIVFSDDGRTVALLGVSDLVVVSSGEGVLVCPKSKAQEVREVVSALKERASRDDQ